MVKQYRLYNRYLEDGEVILDVAHRHILIFKINAIKSLFFGIALPVVFYFFFPQAYLIALAWGFIGFLGVMYHLIDWYFDAWLLTNVGIIDIEKDGLFNITSTRIEYHTIEGISYSIKNIWGMMFNFGDIVLDKLAAKTNVILKDAWNPKKLERKIVKLQDKYVKEKTIKDHNALKTLLGEMIAYHSHHKQMGTNKQK